MFDFVIHLGFTKCLLLCAYARWSQIILCFHVPGVFCCTSSRALVPPLSAEYCPGQFCVELSMLLSYLCERTLINILSVFAIWTLCFVFVSVNKMPYRCALGCESNGEYRFITKCINVRTATHTSVSSHIFTRIDLRYKSANIFQLIILKIAT